MALVEQEMYDNAIFSVGSLDIPLGRLRALRAQLAENPELASAPSPAPDLGTIGGRVWTLYSHGLRVDPAEALTHVVPLVVRNPARGASSGGWRGRLCQSCRW
ncbi:hypothetical protein GCM10023175_35750 [Pseudonocardia xishanensis]|uniref:Uncharacterized protein n=1 Tax=Pseudonocardia xishanensis TaxID=630995 RepID=A0ABP8RTR6_9PSEU